MNTNYTKSALLHRQVRRALQAGRYLPGQRIDPATLAAEFHTSPTPVRFALYRLVGEGLIVDHARSGLYVPLPTEVAMRDLYDWMEIFDGIAAAAGHRSLHRAVKQANDRLAPIRHAKHHLLHDPLEELLTLSRAWHKRDMADLRLGLADYYGRRKKLVPRIVDLLNEGSKRFH